MRLSDEDLQAIRKRVSDLSKMNIHRSLSALSLNNTVVFQDIPALLAEVERLKKVNELLESAHIESDRNKERYAAELLTYRKYAEKFADALSETYVGLEFPEYQEFRKLTDGDAND